MQYGDHDVSAWLQQEPAQHPFTRLECAMWYTGCAVYRVRSIAVWPLFLLEVARLPHPPHAPHDPGCARTELTEVMC